MSGICHMSYGDTFYRNVGNMAYDRSYMDGNGIICGNKIQEGNMETEKTCIRRKITEKNYHMIFKR